MHTAYFDMRHSAKCHKNSANFKTTVHKCDSRLDRDLLSSLSGPMYILLITWQATKTNSKLCVTVCLHSIYKL